MPARDQARKKAVRCGVNNPLHARRCSCWAPQGETLFPREDGALSLAALATTNPAVCKGSPDCYRRAGRRLAGLVAYVGSQKVEAGHQESQSPVPRVRQHRRDTGLVRASSLQCGHMTRSRSELT